MEEIDLSKYVKIERKGEWRVAISVSGNIQETISAGSASEAVEKAFAMIENGEMEVMSSDYGVSFDVDGAVQEPDMYLVRRNGRDLRTTRVLPGDEPRQLNEGGF